MKLTVDIMEDFVQGLDLSGSVLSSSNDGTSTTVLVAKTYHLRKWMTVDLDGVDYVVMAVEDGVSIVVGGVVESPQVYTVTAPFYFHGTPIMTNSHINGAQENQKVPMVYLYEILREKDLRLNSTVRREADLRLFFLDSANFSEWTTDDHYSKRLVGLNNLVDEFIEQARANIGAFYLWETDFTRTNHANWGKYLDNQGHIKTLFDDQLTGVELNFTLSLKNCKL